MAECVGVLLRLPINSLVILPTVSSFGYLTLLLLSAVSAPRFGADLPAKLHSAIAGCGLKKASISVSVRDVSTGALLASASGSRPMIPASNMKVLTTGAAVATLGPEFSFRTRLLQDGDRIVIVGDGDPGFGDPELLAGLVCIDAAGNTRTGLDEVMLLDGWVNAAVAALPGGVTEVVVDDRIFSDERVHPLWPKDQLDEVYCAEVSGLNFHANRLHILPRPAPGKAAEIASIRPAAPWLTVSSRATSKQGKKDSNTAWVSRGAEGATLVLQGNVKSTYGEPIVMTMHDSALFLGRTVASRIAGRGIPVKAVRVAGAADPACSGAALGPVIRTPIATALARANTDSENLYAECLLKRMAAASTGQPGSWASGASVLSGIIQERAGSAEAAGFVYSDGSGLSRSNRVTADGMTAFIAAMARDPRLSATYLDSLAIAGRTGTVRKRMGESANLGVVIRCKTGYINGVSCLSGVVCTPDGRMESFSVLCNDLTEPDAVGKAKAMQDKIALIVANNLLSRSPRPALGG
ncbi:MAG: D-alanyl-D-alanine carboxypeptidase/D-alanyl-D-alanine-endopeptidase [Phycisphaerales bacterium]|nr:D-alanyl-D-alanine carboxypeptidase/D-alanyl-D-alanine-endopeptidase [Phycisphaerales bacterium]